MGLPSFWVAGLAVLFFALVSGFGPGGYSPARIGEAGLRRLYGEQFHSEAVQNRLDHELGIIHHMGFDVYFLIVCRENDMNPLEIKGSYAGAFGQTQFIPSSFYEYAVSFDNDALRDVFNSTEDVLASIANYLSRFGWVLKAPVYVDIGAELKTQELISAHLKGRKGWVDYRTVAEAQNVDLPPPPDNKKLTIVGLEQDPSRGGGFRYVAGYPNFQAITEWNHSNRYAMAVTELAESIRIP